LLPRLDFETHHRLLQEIQTWEGIKSFDSVSTEGNESVSIAN
jgi:hypothetical protein